MDPQFNNTSQDNATVPQQPVLQPQPYTQQFVPPTSAKKSSKSKMKFLLVGVFLSVMLIGGSAAAYVKLVINSPQNIWERAMSSSAQGLDVLLAGVAENKSGAQQIDGTFKLASPFALDGSLQMTSNDKNADMKFDVGAVGSRVNAEVRLVDVETSENPDVYFKLSGLDDVGALMGLGGPELAQFADIVQAVDGQWYTVDHTLLDQALLSANQNGSAPELTAEDVEKIAQSFATVIKDDLLSTDPNKAVFEVITNVGKENFEGTDAYRYEVGVNKEHLKSFLTDLKAAMGDTKLADLVAYSGDKTYEEIVNLDELFKSIDEQDFSKVKADVWVEASGRYVRNIRIYPKEDDKLKNFLDIGIPYQGGEVIPFQVKATFDEDGTVGTVSSGFEYTKSSGEMHGWGKIDMKDASDTITGEYDLTSKPTSNSPNAEKPTDAKSAMELLSLFGFGGTSQFDQAYSPEDIDALINQAPLVTDDVELQ